MFWITGVASEGMAAGEVLVKLWLLWGGVALHWVGKPAGLSTSMGEASVGGLADAAAAYKWGQQEWVWQQPLGRQGCEDIHHGKFQQCQEPTGNSSSTNVD